MSNCIDLTADSAIIDIGRLWWRRVDDVRLMVGVEFYREATNTPAKSARPTAKAKHTTEPTMFTSPGSVRATVSHLLRELAAMVAGDPIF